MRDRHFTYVAVGDSFTEGLDDARPDGTFRGWADLVAEQLAVSRPDLLYANLAVRGRRISHVLDDQVPLVEQWRPSLVTVAIGGNDITGPRCDVPALGRDFHDILARLVGSGADVLAFAGFDPKVMIPLSDVVSQRASDYNRWIRLSAHLLGVRLVDLWTLSRIYERQMWAPDRLHLSTVGHALVAREVLRVLGEDPSGIAEPAADPGDDPAWTARRADDAEWAVHHLAPWLWRAARGRSSGDGLGPKLPEPVPWGSGSGGRQQPGEGRIGDTRGQ